MALVPPSLLFRAHVEFEFPAAGPPFSRQRSSSVPTSVTAACRLTGTSLPGFTAQRGFDGRDFFEFFASVAGVIDHVADTIFAANRRGEKSEHGGFADDERKLLRRHIGLRSFFHAEWRDAQRLHRRLEAGHRRHGRLDADVVSARRAATDPNAMAVTNPAVVRGAARDSEIEIGAFEFLDRGAGIFRQPVIHYFDNTVLEN